MPMATRPVVTVTDAIETAAPTISTVSIGDAAMNVGDVVTSTITVSGAAAGETLTLNASTIGDFALGA